MQTVPKLAATLASLLLISSSIGVNIARYPQVGRMADPNERIDTTATAKVSPDSPPAQQASRDETASPDSSLARETQIEPARSPQVAAPAKNTKVEARIDPHAESATAGLQRPPAVPILGVQPMVPIASLRPAGTVADAPASYDDVRRLPPVDSSGLTVADSETAEFGETLPYPATVTP